MDMYNTRVKGRQIFLENPARDSRKRKEWIEKRRKEKERKKPGVMGRKVAMERGIWKLDRSQTK